MSLLGIREFSRKVSRCIEDVERTGEPAVLTRHGRPVVALVPLDAEGFEDLVLAHVPEYVLSLRAADRELARGETKTTAEVFGEDDDPAREGSESPARRPARC